MFFPSTYEETILITRIMHPIIEIVTSIDEREDAAMAASRFFKGPQSLLPWEHMQLQPVWPRPSIFYIINISLVHRGIGQSIFFN